LNEYDQFDIEYTSKLLFRGFIGFVVAVVLCFIAYLLVLQDNAFRVFKGIMQFSQNYNMVVNPVITTTLVVLTMGLVSTTTWIFPSFSQTDVVPLAIAALLIWIIVGLICGLISKNCWKGAEAAFWAPLFTFIVAIIFAIITVFSVGLLIGGTIAAFGWFLVVVGSAYLAAFSFGISMAMGFIGGYIGSKIFEEY